MSDLRARDLRTDRATLPTEPEPMVELRCPEDGCGRLLIRFRQARGETLVETFCRQCGIKAVWRLSVDRRPAYHVIEKKV